MTAKFSIPYISMLVKSTIFCTSSSFVVVHILWMNFHVNNCVWIYFSFLFGRHPWRLEPHYKANWNVHFHRAEYWASRLHDQRVSHLHDIWWVRGSIPYTIIRKPRSLITEWILICVSSKIISWLNIDFGGFTLWRKFSLDRFPLWRKSWCLME